tara:strand:+ start:9976 stop:12075 length:2100 start_codon:yes stop_codon:yes gene_type:complete
MSETKQPSFHKQLNDVGYFCTEEFADVVENALHKKPMSITMLKGKAGTGKSYLPEKIAELLGCNIYVKQAFKDYDWYDFVQNYVPNEDAVSGFEAQDCELLLAVKESKDKRVVLLLDEWDKTQHSADGMFLEFLQSGRISVKGKEYKANLDNLIIFFTGNDDRLFSEPFIRRMKFIEVEHMPPSLILQILTSKYGGNKDAEQMFNAVINLYNASVLGNLDKPATVQELCDVINDWLRYKSNGKNPRWEELIYTNVTKTRENHNELQRALEAIKNGELRNESEFSKALDVTFFDKDAEVETETISNGYGSMPRMMEKLNIDINFGIDDNDKEVYAEYKRDDAVYTNAYEDAIDNDEDMSQPHFISWYTVTNSTIERSKSYDLREIVEEEQKFRRLVNTDGTLVFVEPNAGKADISDFLEITEANMFIRKATNNEIIFRVTDSGRTRNHNKTLEYNGRWTKEKGCEFIVPTKSIPMFRGSIVEVGWYPDGIERVRLDNITYDLMGGHISTDKYINIRTLGNSKKVLDVIVSGERKPNDQLSYHNMLYKSRTAKIKETKRTTTYDMGWAVVRSWHLKGKPNYKNHVLIKSLPTPTESQNFALHVMFIQKKLGCETIPLFVNMDKSLFLKMPTKAEGGKWEHKSSTRVLRDTTNTKLDVYCINTYENTTFVAMLKKDKENVDDLIEWRRHMLFTRKKMAEKVS